MSDDNLPQDIADTLHRFHFDRVPFEAMRGKLAHEKDPESLHMIRERVLPPAASAVASVPARGTSEWSALDEEGRAMIARGELGVVILAGGMATRFGASVKALAPLYGDTGPTFLDAKLADVNRRGAGAIDVTLMTSFATDDAIAKELGGETAVHRAPQFASLRLTPDGGIFRGNDGRPSLHAPGHGDLPEALSLAGALERYRAKGVRTVLVSNVDNIGATTEPALLAQHRRLGGKITVELVSKYPGDKGGLPVARGEDLVLAEAFRLPKDFPHDSFPLFNTNTLWIDVDALSGEFPWTWCVVRKKVDGREAIQLERLVGELTWWKPTRYVHVPRDGVETRFLPVKEREDLQRLESQIREVLAARVGL